MKLEAGKWYKTKGGENAFVAFVHPNNETERWVGYIEGDRTVFTWKDGGKYFRDQSCDYDLVAAWTEPKIRPFRMEEVPLGAWLTMEGKIGRYLITGAKEVDLVVAGLGGIGYEQARNNCKLSTDGGVTWKPCGVLEGGE